MALVLSPDSRRLVLTRKEESLADIWVWDFTREVLTRATFDGNNHTPIWAPDGATLVFSSDREGSAANLWRVRADGTGKPEGLTTSVNHQAPGSFSPDGQLLVFAEVEMTAGNFDLYVLQRWSSLPRQLASRRGAWSASGKAQEVALGEMIDASASISRNATGEVLKRGRARG